MTDIESLAAQLAGMNFEQLPNEKIDELVESIVGDLTVDDAIAVVERAAARAELQGIMLQAVRLLSSYSQGCCAGAFCGEGLRRSELGPEHISNRYFMAGYNENDDGAAPSASSPDLPF
jgi:hypothetical protein